MSNSNIKNTPLASKQKQGKSKLLQSHSSKKQITNPSLFDWTSDYELSTQEADQIANPKWIIPNLVISSHLIVIPAEPNA